MLGTSRTLSTLALVLWVFSRTLSGGEPELPHLAALEAIEAEVAAAIEHGDTPGAVVLIAVDGVTVFRRAYGQRQVEPVPLAMQTDTLFDLASLTKPVATAASLMVLVDQGKVRATDRVAEHLPEFAAEGKADVTVADLLTHQGGLIADNHLSDYQDGRAEAWRRIAALPLRSQPGERFVYSDVGFLVLGELVERLAGESLAEFSACELYGKLGMHDTQFLPDAAGAARAATTERRDGKWLRGTVHDPRAHAWGGVAGHAGLFSTADDLARFGQMLLNHGSLDGQRVLAAETVELFTARRAVPGGWRTYGWDAESPLSSNRSPLYSPAAFGHGGFTGTALWVDPRHRLVVVFLSTRLHPDGRGTVNPLVARIGTLAVQAVDGGKTRVNTSTTR